MKTKLNLIIHALGRYLVMRSEKQMGADRKGKLFCNDCGRRMHRGDHFKVLSVAHHDCLDPRAVHQMPIGLGCPEAFPQPLGDMLEKERTLDLDRA